MNRYSLLVLAGIAAVSLSACGGSDPHAFPSSRSTGDHRAGAAPFFGGGPAAVDTSSGSCNVTVTGDVTATWASGGGSSAIGYGPWLTAPGTTSVLGPLDESFFILNCDSNAGNYVGFITNSDVEIPMQPASYPVPVGVTAMGTGSAGPLGTVITLDGTDTNWMLSGDGELVITQFDDHHIAGHFTLPVTDAEAAITGTTKGNAVINGTFEFANPG